MSKVLMESLKLDLPALAEMIRSKGRGKDTMLAHITPKEAALLKRRGGSGSVNPDTGLPEFENETDYGPSNYELGYVPAPEQAGPPVPADFESYTGAQTGGAGGMPVRNPQAATMQEMYAGGYFPSTAANYGYADIGFGPGQSAPPTTAADIRGTTFTPKESAMYGYTSPGAVSPAGQEDKSIADRLGLKTSDLTRIGLGGLVAGGLTAQNLARTRQAQQQAGQSQAELQALGTPYQAQGRELVRAAQAGELTPANQQIAAAARAQANQAVATRGGVGQQQAQNAIADLTARLLQGQYDLGLKVMNIGDNYVSGAIKTGLQADQMVNQANQQFYASLAQMAAPFLLGQQPVYQVTPGVK